MITASDLTNDDIKGTNDVQDCDLCDCDGEVDCEDCEGKGCSCGASSSGDECSAGCEKCDACNGEGYIECSEHSGEKERIARIANRLQERDAGRGVTASKGIYIGLAVKEANDRDDMNDAWNDVTSRCIIP